MPVYRLKASAEAERLESTAVADSDGAKSANQNADNYMLAVVLFASSLFFAGIASRSIASEREPPFSGSAASCSSGRWSGP